MKGLPSFGVCVFARPVGSIRFLILRPLPVCPSLFIIAHAAFFREVSFPKLSVFGVSGLLARFFPYREMRCITFLQSRIFSRLAYVSERNTSPVQLPHPDCLSGRFFCLLVFLCALHTTGTYRMLVYCGGPSFSQALPCVLTSPWKVPHCSVSLLRRTSRLFVPPQFFLVN